MVYGYVRVSTKKQHTDRQERNILDAFPSAKLYTDKYTGTTIDRPEFAKLMKKAAAGDTIVFDSVSRMSRNADDGCEVYAELFSKGVELVFLKEPHISTETYRSAITQTISATGNEIADIYIDATNKVIRLLADRQIRIAFEQAEKEVTDTQQRIREGMAASGAGEKISEAKTGTVYNVKKAAKAMEIIQAHSKTFGGTLGDTECMKLAECGRSAYYRYKREVAERMVRA